MLSDNIRNYRKENNMSQDELAEKLEVSRQSVSLWENGQTQPTIDNIIALSKIFNISADDLLKEEKDNTAAEKSDNPEKKSSKVWLIIIIFIAVILIAIAGIFLWNKYNDSIQVDNTASVNDTASQIIDNSNNNSKIQSPAAKPKTKSTTPAKSNQTNATTNVQKFDLFNYCKNFAIKKGELNGDYTIYQQPSNLYGGYEDEYFSISYWGDSDMVEFCLHCPLDNTYSVNFYLRMRGGYDGEYEYLTSRYYRSNGESVRSATGTIDPKVFSESYPLNCDEYIGTSDKQTSFMEESRVGMCDLIKLLKKFAEVEKMECGFSGFEFVNF